MPLYWGYLNNRWLARVNLAERQYMFIILKVYSADITELKLSGIISKRLLKNLCCSSKYQVSKYAEYIPRRKNTRNSNIRFKEKKQYLECFVMAK